MEKLSSSLDVCKQSSNAFAFLITVVVTILSSALLFVAYIPYIMTGYHLYNST